MSAAKIDWLPAEGGHGHLPEGGRGEGGVGLGLGCLSQGRTMISGDPAVRRDGGSDGRGVRWARGAVRGGGSTYGTPEHTLTH